MEAKNIMEMIIENKWQKIGRLHFSIVVFPFILVLCWDFFSDTSSLNTDIVIGRFITIIVGMLLPLACGTLTGPLIQRKHIRNKLFSRISKEEFDEYVKKEIGDCEAEIGRLSPITDGTPEWEKISTARTKESLEKIISDLRSVSY